MKKIILLLVIAIITLTSCNKEEKEVSINNVETKKEIVDVKIEEKLENNTGSTELEKTNTGSESFIKKDTNFSDLKQIRNSGFLKNKNGIYIKEGDKLIKVNGILNINKFEEIGGTFEKGHFQDAFMYFEDDINVYLYSWYPNPKLDIIIGADVKTFERVKDNGNLAKDKNNVWFGNKKLDKADTKTFEYFKSTDTLKDKNYAYSNDIVLYIPGLDISTYENVNSYFAKDKNNVYCREKTGIYKKLKGADVETFKYIENIEYRSSKSQTKLAKDKNYFYNELCEIVSDKN